MRKMWLVLLVLGLMILGCAAMYHYRFTLLEPLPTEKSALVYSDSLFTIHFNFPTHYRWYRQIDFTLLNNSNKNIKIDWDNSTYVDDKNISHRIAHGSIKMIETEKAQMPSIIAPNSKFSDFVIPADHINLNPTTYTWEIDDLFSYDARSKTIYLILNFKIDDKPIDYKFAFKVDNIKGN